MPNANREFKDSLFKSIFGAEEHKEWALELYNAISGKNYTEPNAIIFNTIDEFLYLGINNDVSFLIDDNLNLYEQQSTFNPNMPYRMLEYSVPVYNKYIIEHKLNKFGSTLMKLPTPKLVVFYNGTRNQPDEKILRLSDAYEEGFDPDIEVRVRMININYGKNENLLAKCKPLSEYSWFVHEVREEVKRLQEEDSLQNGVEEQQNKATSEIGQMSETAGTDQNSKDAQSKQSKGNKEGQNDQAEQDKEGKESLGVLVEQEKKEQESQEVQEEQEKKEREDHVVQAEKCDVNQENEGSQGESDAQKGEKEEAEKKTEQARYLTILEKAIDHTFLKMRRIL